MRVPGYLRLHGKGLLVGRVEAALALLAPCRLCPRACGADRLRDETGFCGTGRLARVASFAPHFGEEACLVGRGGSGTIFFSGCNLRCAFCQNADISRDARAGVAVTASQLAGVMLDLQAQGVQNINLVSPSHVAAHILEALPLAADQGLELPLVYNTGGYDSPETLRLLDGVVDIYMPDAKFWDRDTAARLCGAPDYPEAARRAIRAMHAQAGELRLGPGGLAERGLLVRHLVLPEGLAGTRRWMTFLAREVSPNTYVNLMDQYRPCGDVRALPAALRRTLTPEEFRRAGEEARAAGISRFDARPPGFLEQLLRRLAEPEA